MAVYPELNTRYVTNSADLQAAIDAAYAEGRSWDDILFIQPTSDCVLEYARDTYTGQPMTSDGDLVDGVVILSDPFYEADMPKLNFNVPLYAVRIDDNTVDLHQVAEGTRILANTDITAGNFNAACNAADASLKIQAYAGTYNDVLNEFQMVDKPAPNDITHSFIMLRSNGINVYNGAYITLPTPISFAAAQYLSFWYQNANGTPSNVDGDWKMGFSSSATPADGDFTWIPLPSMSCADWQCQLIDMTAPGGIYDALRALTVRTISFKQSTATASGIVIRLKNLKFANHPFIARSPARYASANGVPITQAVYPSLIPTTEVGQTMCTAKDLWKAMLSKGVQFGTHPTIDASIYADNKLLLQSLLGEREILRYTRPLAHSIFLPCTCTIANYDTTPTIAFSTANVQIAPYSIAAGDVIEVGSQVITIGTLVSGQTYNCTGATANATSSECYKRYQYYPISLGCPAKTMIQSGQNTTLAFTDTLAKTFNRFGQMVQQWYEYSMAYLYIGSRSRHFRQTDWTVSTYVAAAAETAPTRNTVITGHQITTAGGGNNNTWAQWKTLIDRLATLQTAGKIACVTLETLLSAETYAAENVHSCKTAGYTTNLTDNTGGSWSSTSAGTVSAIRFDDLNITPGRTVIFSFDLATDGASKGVNVKIHPQQGYFDAGGNAVNVNSKYTIRAGTDYTVGTVAKRIQVIARVPIWAYNMGFYVYLYPETGATATISNISYVER